MDKSMVASELLEESISLSVKMLDLADRGIGGCQDDGCLVLYGIIRDCAYRIGAGAEKELNQHRGGGELPEQRAITRGE